MHRDDPNTKTREGRRQLSRSWREETAYDLSEPKGLPQEHDNNAGDKGQLGKAGPFEKSSGAGEPGLTEEPEMDGKPEVDGGARSGAGEPGLIEEPEMNGSQKWMGN